MKIFLRCLLIFVAPIVALALTLAGSALFIVGIYHNPVQDRVNDAVESHLAKNKNIPVSSFHANIFVASKDIAQGEKLAANDMERQDYISSYQDPDKITDYDDEQLVGATTRKAISKGQLIFEDDLADHNHVSEPWAADKTVKDDSDFNILSWTLLGMWVVSVVGTVVALIAGQIWVLVVAFQRHILWGISCLLLPLAAGIFEVKYWQQTKKAFQLKLLGCGLLGISIGCVIGIKVKGDVLENQLAKAAKILITAKDIPEGTTLTENDFTELPYQARTTPMDALTSSSQAVGHKTLIKLTKGMILSADEVTEKPAK